MHRHTHAHTHTHTHTSSHHNLSIQAAKQRLMNMFYTQVLFTNIFHRNNISAMCTTPVKDHHPDGKHGYLLCTWLSYQQLLYSPSVSPDHFLSPCLLVTSCSYLLLVSNHFSSSLLTYLSS